MTVIKTINGINIYGSYVNKKGILKTIAGFGEISKKAYGTKTDKEGNFIIFNGKKVRV